MKTKDYSVTTAIVIVLALICAGICAWQTVFLLSNQGAFAADHPDYIPHSWYLLALLAATAILGGVQLVLRSKPVLCGVLSVLVTVPEVLAIRAAADQHYHMGMLISDYGISAPFDGGWLLLILAVALIIATVAQLLMALFAALRNYGER